MRYPDTERALFAEQIKRFHDGYQMVMERAVKVFTEKAKLRDTTTPIWHTYRYPESFIDQVHQKIKRCDSTWAAAQAGHVTEAEALQEIANELPDIINYAAYLAALIEIFRTEEPGKGDIRVLGTGNAERPSPAIADRREAVSSGARPSSRK